MHQYGRVNQITYLVTDEIEEAERWKKEKEKKAFPKEESLLITWCPFSGADGILTDEKAFLTMKEEGTWEAYLTLLSDRKAGRPRILGRFDREGGETAADPVFILRELSGEDRATLRDWYEQMLPEAEKDIEPIFLLNDDEQTEKEKLAAYQKAMYELCELGLWGLFFGPCLVGLFGLTPGCDGVEISYSLLPSYRKRGLARRIVRFVLDWACEMEMGEVFAVIRKENKASLSLANELGLPVKMV